MNYKLQLGCLIVILYIIIMYLHGIKKLHRKHVFNSFDLVLASGFIYLIFDMITVYTVNHLDTVPVWLNYACHAVFLLLIDLIIFLFFYYLIRISGILLSSKAGLVLLWSPLIINESVILVTISKLYFLHGKTTNYSMGIPVYTCYIMMVLYTTATIFLFFRSWHFISSQKRASILVYIIACAGITIFQMIFPESLVSSLAVTITILCLYINTKSPAVLELENTYEHMMHSFADIIESRDGSTGNHVKRTTAYVGIILKGMKQHDYYQNILTQDYIDELLQAAPMHDIGKISTPDAILQKPGRLTAEEYEIMKTHTTNGAEIIRKTLSTMGDHNFVDLVTNVALCHHEKWDGTGYPQGLTGDEIPLCARIMAIADVFDAVSAKRCYRDAMTLEQSFKIIEDGYGTAFEPLLVDVFMEMKNEIIHVHDTMQED
ncbi:MAG: HD-GYP domain-containing protein [Eubacterium sp.]